MTSRAKDAQRLGDALAARREARAFVDESHPAILLLDMGHHPELAQVTVNEIQRRVL